MPRYSIIIASLISQGTVWKILNKLVGLMPDTNFLENKLGGPGFVVQIDETMLNYKCKSHRGRNPKNETGALCAWLKF